MPSPFPGMDPYNAGVALELQGALTTAYGLLECDLMIGYSRPPVPPLDDQASALAGNLLRAAGRRPA